MQVIVTEMQKCYSIKVFFTFSLCACKFHTIVSTITLKDQTAGYKFMFRC